MRNIDGDDGSIPLVLAGQTDREECKKKDRNPGSSTRETSVRLSHPAIVHPQRPLSTSNDSPCRRCGPPTSGSYHHLQRPRSLHPLAVDQILRGDLPDGVHVYHVAPSGQGFAEGEFLRGGPLQQRKALIADRGGTTVRRYGQHNEGQVDVVGR